MQYQVLARKWRPQNFHDLVGQDHVSRTLLNALQSGRVAHAFLFSGPRGSGKTTSARILAKALNCHTGKPGEPCGECVACVEIAAGNCLDVLEIDAASNTGVDNVRELIDQVRYHPARDRNKIFIIDEVHMLSNAAFNALLKTLEEPPPHVVFIMATTEYHKIPATILSRCQQYSFKLIRFPLILDRLQHIARAENIQISTASLEQVAFSSGGSMRDAMSALDQVIAFSGGSVKDEDVTMLLGLVEPALLGRTVRAIADNDTDAILKVAAELAETGQDFQNFCRRLLSQFRHLMVLKAGVSEPSVLGVPESLVPDLQAQSDLFSREDMLRMFDGLLKVEADLKHATQVRFQLEMGLIELAHLARLRSLEELIAEVRALSGGNEPGGPPRTPVPAGRTGPTTGSAPRRIGSSQTPPQPERKAAPTSPVETLAAVEPPKPSEAAVVAPRLEVPQDARELLLKIATSVHKESLESFLQAMQGARLEGDAVVLEPGSVNEFYRQQVRANLALITEAAGRVVGQGVTVRLGDTTVPQPSRDPDSRPPTPIAPVTPSGSAPTPALERAKREPIVQSFLEAFPGPVRAEDLDR